MKKNMIRALNICPTILTGGVLCQMSMLPYSHWLAEHNNLPKENTNPLGAPPTPN